MQIDLNIVFILSLLGHPLAIGEERGSLPPIFDPGAFYLSVLLEGEDSFAFFHVVFEMTFKLLNFVFVDYVTVTVLFAGFPFAFVDLSG